jgi:two-component system, NarL family, sensor histidine kinase UhpB
MPHTSQSAAVSKSVRWYPVLRYGLAIVCFGATVGLSILLSNLGIRLNLTIPIVLALVATAWYGGRGPGLLISILFQATTILYTTIPPDSSVGLAVFGYFSVFALYVFLVLLISNVREIQLSLREQRDLLKVTLSSIGDGVIATDTKGLVTFMNPVAEKFTGWDEGSAKGLHLEQVVRIVNEETRDAVVNPVHQVLETGAIVGLANHSVLIAKDGTEMPIDDSAAPIVDRGKIIGVVLVFSNVTERKLAERAKRESAIMQSLVEAQEAERRRIARDLHDHLGQKMTALRLRIEALNENSSSDPRLGEMIESVQDSAAQIDRDIAFLSWELRPTELENLGLVDALCSFVREWSRQYGIAADFHVSNADRADLHDRLAQKTETNIYRIVQEALNNVLKHADAKEVNVLLHNRKDHMVLIIEDNGRGFDQETGPLDTTRLGGQGIIGMRERAAVMNGMLEIDSKKGGGTAVVVRIPISETASEPEAKKKVQSA